MTSVRCPPNVLEGTKSMATVIISILVVVPLALLGWDLSASRRRVTTQASETPAAPQRLRRR